MGPDDQRLLHQPRTGDRDACRSRGYEGRGPLLLLFFLLVLFLTDVLQIVFSAALDGRALKSNPNKTVNGVLAGSACGALVGTRYGG